MRGQAAAARLAGLRGRPGAQARPGRCGQAGEAARGTGRGARPHRFGDGDQIAQEGAVVGAGHGRLARRGCGRCLVGGEQVGEMGDVLALQDLLRAQVGGGRANHPVDDRQRVGQPGQVLAPAGYERQVQRVAGEPARRGRSAAGRRRPTGAARRAARRTGRRCRCPFPVWAWRPGRSGRRADSDRAGTRPHTSVAPCPASRLGVLPGDDAPHVLRCVQGPVVVVAARLAPQRSRAPHQHAWGAVELVDHRGECRAGGERQTGAARAVCVRRSGRQRCRQRQRGSRRPSPWSRSACSWSTSARASRSSKCRASRAAVAGG